MPSMSRWLAMSRLLLLKPPRVSSPVNPSDRERLYSVVHVHDDLPNTAAGPLSPRAPRQTNTGAGLDARGFLRAAGLGLRMIISENPTETLRQYHHEQAMQGGGGSNTPPPGTSRPTQTNPPGHVSDLLRRLTHRPSAPTDGFSPRLTASADAALPSLSTAQQRLETQQVSVDLTAGATYLQQQRAAGGNVSIQQQEYSPQPQMSLSPTMTIGGASAPSVSSPPVSATTTFPPSSLSRLGSPNDIRHPGRGQLAQPPPNYGMLSESIPPPPSIYAMMDNPMFRTQIGLESGVASPLRGGGGGGGRGQDPQQQQDQQQQGGMQRAFIRRASVQRQQQQQRKQQRLDAARKSKKAKKPPTNQRYNTDGAETDGYSSIDIKSGDEGISPLAGGKKRARLLGVGQAPSLFPPLPPTQPLYSALPPVPQRDPHTYQHLSTEFVKENPLLKLLAARLNLFASHQPAHPDEGPSRHPRPSNPPPDRTVTAGGALLQPPLQAPPPRYSSAPLPLSAMSPDQRRQQQPESPPMLPVGESLDAQRLSGMNPLVTRLDLEQIALLRARLGELESQAVSATSNASGDMNRPLLAKSTSGGENEQAQQQQQRDDFYRRASRIQDQLYPYATTTSNTLYSNQSSIPADVNHLLIPNVSTDLSILATPRSFLADVTLVSTAEGKDGMMHESYTAVLDEKAAREMRRAHQRREARAAQLNRVVERLQSARTWRDRIKAEMALLLMAIRNYLIPSDKDINAYAPWFTPLFILGCTAYFFYMAGSYRFYRAATWTERAFTSGMTVQDYFVQLASAMPREADIVSDGVEVTYPTWKTNPTDDILPSTLTLHDATFVAKPDMTLSELPLEVLLRSLRMQTPRIGASQLVNGCWPTFRKSTASETLYDGGCFSVDFVNAWGALHLREILAPNNERWRFISALFLSQSLEHFILSMILLTRLSFALERAYGGHRVFALIVLSGLGGALTAALFEANCYTIVGVSGCIFGLIGTFIADMWMNYEAIKYPWLKILMIALFFVQIIVQATVSPTKVSWSMHLGGFFSGFGLAFIFIPNLYRSIRVERILPIVSAVTVALFFVAFPIMIFVTTTPKLKNCHTIAT